MTKMDHNAQTGRVFTLPDANAQATYLADWILEQALAKKDGFLSIALSGGSTPQKLYELLGSPAYARKMPWSRIHLFFGDERMVPPTHEASNHHMVNKALLSHIDIPFRNVHPMPTFSDADDAAKIYQRELEIFYGNNQLDAAKPLFDIVFLGLGNDGHTASLFPKTPVLQEKTKWVSWCDPTTVPYRRLTLTYPTLASSRHVVFVVSGEGKKDILKAVRSGENDYPAAAISTTGELSWVIDKAASSE